MKPVCNWAYPNSTPDRIGKAFSRKRSKAQTKSFRNALCAFASLREKLLAIQTLFGQTQCNLIAIFLFSAMSLPVVYSQTVSNRVIQQRSQDGGGALVEEFSFLLSDFKIDHQGETNKLDISISYRYVPNVTKSQYPDFRSLAKDVETLLTNYPNEDDYWEIVNKQLTSMLLKKYPALSSVTCELKVHSSRLVPYSRSSRVTRERSAKRR